ncbi:MAG: apolipoprotein N-acyltransferase [Microcystaceae cyanobacterium]
MKYFYSGLLLFISGLATALAAPPYSFYGLAWISFIPLWWIIAQQKTTLKQSILGGFLWGLGYYGLALSWILGVHPMTWMGVPWLASLSIALFCWIFIILWGSFITIFWSIGLYFVYHTSPKAYLMKWPITLSLTRVLVAISMWCGLEWLWSQGDLWWSAIAYTQSPNNLWLLQLERWSGVSTITFILLGINGLITEAILSPLHRLKLLVSALLLLISSHTIGFYYYQLPLSDSVKEEIKIGIIQGNIPNEIKLYEGGIQKAIEGYTEGYNILANQGVELVLTPETALPFSIQTIIQRSSFYKAILKKEIPVMLGAFDRNNNQYSNSLFMLDKNGKLISQFDKIKLVPLGEYIPFQSLLGDVINRLSPLDSHLQKGDNNQIFHTPFGKAIVGICYESAYAEHFRRQASQGGQFIVTASNDSHYSSSMLMQHHALDVMRGIETNRWVARATNTGYSATINPRGETLWISQMNNYQLHQDIIYPRQNKTLYVKWGDWLTKLALMLGVIGYLLIKQR